MVEESQFNARADAAMRAMKAQMGLPETPVPDGQPQRAPVPGSYAEQLQKQRQAQMEQSPPTIGRNTQPMEEPPHPSDNGELADPTQPAQQEGAQQRDENGVPFNQHPLYNRFAQVSRERTDYKRQLAELKAQREKDRQDAEAYRKRLEQMEAERQQLLQQQFETLPPEERAALLARNEVNQALQSVERRMEERFGKLFQSTMEERTHREYEALSRKYPAFDFDRHAPLIDTFREANPACSVEHAFRAIAEDGELGVNGRTVRRSPPPVTIPGVPATAAEERGYDAPGSSQEKEEQRLIQGAQRLREIATAPGAEQHQVMEAAAQSIKDRMARKWDQRGMNSNRR